jgi:uncharacterized protein
MTRRAARFGGGPTHAALLLAGAAVGAWVFTLLNLPAGTLIGAVVGSAVVNRSPWMPTGARPLPVPIRVVGLALLGCAAGVRLDGDTLVALGHIALPLVASILALVVLDLVLAVVLVRRYDVDPLTAVLACAPGGVSEIAVTGAQMGAEMGVLLAIHTVRVLAVVLLVLPVLVALLGPT